MKDNPMEDGNLLDIWDDREKGITVCEIIIP